MVGRRLFRENWALQEIIMKTYQIYLISFFLGLITYLLAYSFPTYAWHFGWIGGALAVYIIKNIWEIK